jgi:hypothetical protein
MGFEKSKGKRNTHRLSHLNVILNCGEGILLRNVNKGR